MSFSTSTARGRAPGILYISYDGMLEPLGQSQVLAYLERLAPGRHIHLISFEKARDWTDGVQREAMSERLRRADAIVRHLSHASDFESAVWQFPVVLIPFGTDDRPDSIVLRPIDSVDGMTANVVRMPKDLLEELVRELKAIPGVAGVFYDMTNKPPATIEWE